MQDFNKYKDKEILQSYMAKIIKNLRKERKKSISLISAEIGISKSIWADLEKGIKDPQLSTLWRISEGLGVPLSSVISEIERFIPADFSLLEN